MKDIDLRLGDWRTALADVGEVDAVITDPPYSERTHAGSDAVSGRTKDGADRAELGYAPWAVADVDGFVSYWAARTRSWIVILTDSILIPDIRSAYRNADRYDFAPVPIIQHKPRMSGDGPASACVYLMASRPREARFMQWGSLPGFYMSRPEHAHGVMGAKPLELMRAIVRDYTRPGDLVADPHCGSGTTLRACAIEGRRCVSAEIDPKTYKIASDRLRGWGAEEHKGMGNLFAGLK